MKSIQVLKAATCTSCIQTTSMWLCLPRTSSSELPSLMREMESDWHLHAKHVTKPPAVAPDVQALHCNQHQIPTMQFMRPSPCSYPTPCICRVFKQHVPILPSALSPEEEVLMLAALGFKPTTSIYVADTDIYGGKSRMVVFRSLYPNLATKESLISSSEIKPFLNLSYQLVALDFTVWTVVNEFAMTDSESQFSSLMKPTEHPNWQYLHAYNTKWIRASSRQVYTPREGGS